LAGVSMTPEEAASWLLEAAELVVKTEGTYDIENLADAIAAYKETHP